MGCNTKCNMVKYVLRFFTKSLDFSNYEKLFHTKMSSKS